MCHRARWPFAGLLAGLAAACGGGGGGGAAPVGSPFVAGPVTSLGANYPLALGVGYFDGDGRLDLVVPGGDLGANAFEWSAGVYLGRPDGTFVARAPVTVGVPPPFEINRALVGHFDDGASTDFVVVAGRHYGVLLGNGDGTFDAGAPFLRVLPSGLVGTDAAVIDGDGNFHDDLVVGTLSGSIVFLLGDGAGGFQVSDVIPVTAGQIVVQLEVADLNGDDIDDVVALDSGSGITVLFGDLAGSLTFGSKIFGALPGTQDAKGIVVGGFDATPGIDLAVMSGPFATPTPHLTVTVVTGDGAGGFGVIDGAVDLPEAEFAFPVRAGLLHTPAELRAAFVVAARPAASASPTLHLVRTDAAGQPTATTIPVPGGATAFQAIDMDDDWQTDLVVLALNETTYDLTAQVLFRASP